MNNQNLPCPGDAVGPIVSSEDPRAPEPCTDQLDQAQQRIVTRLIEGGTFCKVRIEDVFDSLIEKDRPLAIEILVRTCQLSQLHGEVAKNETDDLVKLAAQYLDDFVEADDNLRDSMLEEIEEDERIEAMEEGPPFYGEAA